ncbi:MAG: lactaldehyde reductase [Clostridia bacterium]|nr:lactaldehyde reductase [Clostridia bacterium]
MANRFILNETSYFGRGAREVLSTEIKNRGFNKVLVVTDKTLLECGVAGKVTAKLDNAGIAYDVFAELKPNPTVKNVQDGVEACKNSGADVIVTVGGGSAIDTAKGISIIMTNPEHADVVSLNGVVETKNHGLPIIALPTTAGTAAEVTINYVITDEERDVKMVCIDPHDIPVLAIVDTELMETMPKSIAAATGLDALTHAIEGYITKGANLMSDMFHMKAIQLIFENLPAAVNEKNPEAVEKMGYAQYIAGMGFSNVGLGIVHSLAHQLGAVYDTPHGIANAILLPYVMEFNGEVCYERFREILLGLGITEAKEMNKEELIARMVSEIRELSAKVGVTQTVSEVGGKEEDLDMLAEKAFVDPCYGGNPRTASVEDLKNLYKAAM